MKKILSMCLAVIVTSMLLLSFAGFAPAPATLDITAKSAFLVEVNSGKVLFQKNADAKLPIASMVKIMTLAVIYDAIDAGDIALTDMVMVSQEAESMGGSQAFLDFNAEYKVEDLILSIVIASANDSCVAMAEHIAGSESEFVNRMNALAEKLGMTNTNFVNATGLPAPGGYSTAADVAKMYAYIMQKPTYNLFTATWMYDLNHPSGRITGLTNTNKHARFFNGCDGGKTGFTQEAGHCIAVASKRGDLRPLAVIVGASDSKTRFAESADLMNHVFESYQNKKIVSKDEAIGEIALKGSANDTVQVFPSRDLFDLVKKGDKTQPKVHVEIEKAVKAPITATDSVGTISITIEGKVIAEVAVVTGQDIDALTYWGSVKKVVGKYKF